MDLVVGLGVAVGSESGVKVAVGQGVGVAVGDGVTLGACRTAVGIGTSGTLNQSQGGNYILQR